MRAPDMHNPSDDTLPSLIPYLDCGPGGFGLAIALQNTSPMGDEGPYFPFNLISESGPFSRVILGHLVSDAHSTLKRVFLLMSKDRYTPGPNPLAPLSNNDVAACWQRAFGDHCRREGAIVLAAQSAPERLRPFRPLFFCRRQGLFFEPACPVCQGLLDECTDDGRLSHAGLMPHGTTLRRYLFCPQCAQDFYVPLREGADPPCVHDLQSLIRTFGGQEGLPCHACEERANCYGGPGLAERRIVPLSFFPFYLLVTPAADLSAMDYLALVSGARPDELQTRRQACGLSVSCSLARFSKDSVNLFFPTGPRRFLEVLYLKLTLLGQLSALLAPRMGNTHWPDLPLDLERLWVELPAGANDLPGLWNPQLRLLDLGDLKVASPLLPLDAPRYVLGFLGSLWFCMLLPNQDLTSATIQGLLRSDSRPGAAGNAPPAPEDIFWEDSRLPVAADYAPLWERALDLGRSLVRQAGQSEGPWSLDGFEEALAALRSEIRSALFDVPQTTRRAAQDHDPAIHTILLNIRRRWEASALQTPQTGPSPATGKATTLPQEDVMQTVLIRSAPPPTHVTEAPHPAATEKGRAPSGIAPAAQTPPHSDDLEATVMFTPEGNHAPADSAPVSNAPPPVQRPGQKKDKP